MRRDFVEDLCRQALEKFGEPRQLTKVAEECAELIQAISKYTLDPTDENEEHIVEEAVDTMLMVVQLRLMFGKDKWRKKMLEKTENLRMLVGDVKEGWTPAKKIT